MSVRAYRSDMLAAEQIAEMSTADRLETMEQLWDSLDEKASASLSPAWHGEILAERSKIADSDAAQWITIGELQNQLLDR